MSKRIIIVHRWGGAPDSDWYPWLRSMLAERGFEVLIPAMPNTTEPHISAWVPHLAKTVGKADEDTYFIGHSIGCQTILRYLESLDKNVKVGGAVFVAGWLHLKPLESDEEEVIAAEWVKNPINLKLVRNHLQRSVAIFSDDDPYVPLSEAKIFENEIGSKIIIHPKRGHFTSEDNASELHVALNEILKLAKSQS